MEDVVSTDSRPASYYAILEAAVAEFAEHGYDGVRMEKIAARAGLNKSLVYRHFENREKLFEAALESVFAERFELLEDLPKDLNELFELWTKRMANDPQFIKMLMREALELDAAEPIHADLRRRYYAHQIKTIKEIPELRRLPDDVDEESLFLMLTAILVFPYLLPQIAMLVTGKAPDSRAFKRRWKKLFRTFIECCEWGESQ